MNRISETKSISYLCQFILQRTIYLHEKMFLTAARFQSYNSVVTPSLVICSLFQKGLYVYAKYHQNQRDVIFCVCRTHLNCKLYASKCIIGVGRGGGQGGARPPNNLGGGANIPFGPPNNPPAFSFNFYVKREKNRNVPR